MNKRQYKKQYKKYCKAFQISYDKIAKAKKENRRLTVVQSSFDSMVRYYLCHKKYINYKSIRYHCKYMDIFHEIYTLPVLDIDFSSLYKYNGGVSNATECKINVSL